MSNSDQQQAGAHAKPHAHKDSFESVYFTPGWEVATPVRVTISDFVLNIFYGAKNPINSTV
jgi:hypothetical protein